MTYVYASEPLMLPVGVETYDCALSLVLGFDHLLKSGISLDTILSNAVDTSFLEPSFFLNYTYNGATGPLEYDSQGNRLYGVYDIYSVMNNSLTGWLEAEIYIDATNASKSSVLFENTTSFGTAVWNVTSPLLNIPVDFPPLVFMNPTLLSSRGVFGASLALIALATVSALYLTILAARKHQKLRLFNSLYVISVHLAIILCMLSVVSELGVPSQALCRLFKYGMENIKVSLIGGCIASKMLRFLMIRRSTKISQSVLPNNLLLTIVAAILAINTIITLLLDILSVLSPVNVATSADGLSVYALCMAADPSINSIVSGLQIGFNSGVFLVSAVYAVELRNSICYR
ncbi:uncharacterized protein BJ171DRAFT_36340 [Polychytrium aggregatum]|uniref:uncharacterized protein n=1 Tax=Polychytrium aggregatum TaxID=110093 RepID=UPI0022FF057D|nr:uncharacterized protein BJ171DRAFT_36340 [Polychytrium aggregatum]KAI9190856.1 hypothetical protein BJ171DRAFT_36340 [Polychytrium aggregatum]